MSRQRCRQSGAVAGGLLALAGIAAAALLAAAAVVGNVAGHLLRGRRPTRASAARAALRAAHAGLVTAFAAIAILVAIVAVRAVLAAPGPGVAALIIGVALCAIVPAAIVLTAGRRDR